MKDESRILPGDTAIVSMTSIEQFVVNNTAQLLMQVMQHFGDTKETLDERVQQFSEDATQISIFILSAIRIAGGDYSKDMPPPEQFEAIFQAVANENAYSIEMDVTT